MRNVYTRIKIEDKKFNYSLLMGYMLFASNMKNGYGYPYSFAFKRLRLELRREFRNQNTVSSTYRRWVDTVRHHGGLMFKEWF